MNHGHKTREKLELQQMIDIVQDQHTGNFWEANLRNSSKLNQIQSRGQSAALGEGRCKTYEKEYTDLMNMEKTVCHRQKGRGPDNAHNVTSTEVTKVPAAVTIVRTQSL